MGVSHRWGWRWLVAACACALAMSVGATQAQAFIYWGDGESYIGRANLDGSGANPRFSHSPAPALAVDRDHIYSCTSVGNVLRSNIDGTGLAAIVEAVDTPEGVAVDALHVYWSNGGARHNQPAQPGQPAGGVPPSIGRANLDGSAASSTFITTGTAIPHGVAVDAGHIYWASVLPGPTFSGSIGRANLDGSSPEPNFITGLAQPFGLTVDQAHVYWSDGTTNTIGRANLDGTSPEPGFISGASFPVAVAVDRGHLYWANARNKLGQGSIGRANLDGSRVDQNLISPLTALTGLAVDAGAAAPSSAFTFVGKPVIAKGFATLKISVPGPGRLTAAQAGVTKRSALIKAVRATVAKAGTVTLTFRPTKAGARALTKRRVSVKATITYTPTGGKPKTATKPIILGRVKYIR